MFLIELHERIKSRKNYKTSSGCVERIFEINERRQKNESGEIPVYIKITPEEKLNKMKLKNI